jgi:hypothetical protein
LVGEKSGVLGFFSAKTELRDDLMNLMDESVFKMGM